MPAATDPLPRDAPLRAIAFMLAGAVSFATMNALARGMRHLPWPMLGFSRALLGLAMCSGISSPSHVPSSVSLAGIAVVALVLVRPGPLTVDTGVETVDSSTAMWRVR